VGAVAEKMNLAKAEREEQENLCRIECILDLHMHTHAITGLARHYMSLNVIISHYIIWHGLRIMTYNDTISSVII
jgi:hypothetical protein